MAEARPILKFKEFIQRKWAIQSRAEEEIEIYSPGGTKLFTIRMPVKASIRDLKTRITELSGKHFLDTNSFMRAMCGLSEGHFY